MLWRAVRKTLGDGLLRISCFVVCEREANVRRVQVLQIVACDARSELNMGEAMVSMLLVQKKR